MTIITKPDRRGRDGNRPASKRVRKALALPQGVGWNVALPGHLLESPAWIALSPQGLMLLSGLMAEQASHNGLENGNLLQTYDQLVARGMRRGSILTAIYEAEALGLIAATRGVRAFGSRRLPSRYRLTWLGTPDGLGPTNEWRAVKTADEAHVRLNNARDRLATEREAKAARRAVRANDIAADDQEQAVP